MRKGTRFGELPATGKVITEDKDDAIRTRWCKSTGPPWWCQAMKVR
jgi:hypothetical protein